MTEDYYPGTVTPEHIEAIKREILDILAHNNGTGLILIDMRQGKITRIGRWVYDWLLMRAGGE